MNFKLFVFAILFIFSVIGEEEANLDENNEVDATINLNDSNFEDVLKTNNFFVMFYAPW